LARNKRSNRGVRCGRVCRQVVMSFSFKHDELGIGDCFREMMSGIVVRSIGCAVPLVIADQHQGWNANFF